MGFGEHLDVVVDDFEEVTNHCGGSCLMLRSYFTPEELEDAVANGLAVSWFERCGLSGKPLSQTPGGAVGGV